MLITYGGSQNQPGHDLFHWPYLTGKGFTTRTCISCAYNAGRTKRHNHARRPHTPTTYLRARGTASTAGDLEEFLDEIEMQLCRRNLLRLHHTPWRLLSSSIRRRSTRASAPAREIKAAFAQTLCSLASQLLSSQNMFDYDIIDSEARPMCGMYGTSTLAYVSF